MDPTLQPLINDGPVIFWHAICALAALVLAGWQLLGAKGTRAHRFLGRGWAILMATVALSSFWIHELEVFGVFSPIHLLSIVTLVSLPLAVVAARRGQIARHRAIMISLFVTGLIIPGIFTLLPGRTMHAVLFGG
ncbi:DUF2306 domain-containing protein [Tateyamaria pelophila]|uniref:DUF2306 domain-containing protein n=1 Tax=Tateyamaria pelophila TaxID=328415 RepID=UPI001CC02C42|nr:DUF2306 domain-containing protein [Tateyamaria pelophila]